MEVVNFKAPVSLHNEVRAAAQIAGVSKGEWIRRALKTRLKRANAKRP